MHPRVAAKAVLAGLITGGLIVAATTPAHARPRAARATLAARIAPPVVTAGEPAAVAARLSTARSGRTVTVQALTGGSWVAVGTGTTDAQGRVTVPVDTTTTGSTSMRAVLGGVVSPPASLTVRAAAACTPTVPLVDKLAGPEATCLAARLDRWRNAGLMGVGQELNMSTLPYQAPLTALGDRRVSVLGFDLWELGKTKTYEYPFFDQAFADLVTAAQGGAVLTASWHAPNPHTGGAYNDRSWHQLSAVLNNQTPEAQAFWASYDEQLAVLKAFQDAGVAVVFRPLHEGNGDWFWWGRASASTYRAVWLAMQKRAWAAGVHNVVWAYSFAASDRRGITPPEQMLPGKVDVAGIDTYWPASGTHRSQVPAMDGYAAVARKVRRMAFTEIGPYADTKRTWNASTISSAARAQARKPVWALAWVDDAGGAKQISSLRGGRAWLDSCPFGYCVVG